MNMIKLFSNICIKHIGYYKIKFNIQIILKHPHRKNKNNILFFLF